MRKCLGVLAGMAALCAMSWAQASAPTQAPAQDSTQTQAPSPAPAPPPTIPIPTPKQGANYPRFEFFAGGTYAEAGFFNAGHWAGLYGWDSSLGLNAASWLGLVVGGGQFFGTSKIPSAVPAPFPPGQFYEPSPSPTFNVATREYNFIFGAQFARRKYGRWTPRGEVLYGHQSARGIATPVTPGPRIAEVGPGRAVVVGGGVDRDITPRLALRFKADYFATGTAFPSQPKQTQDNFRFSVGIVIRNVHKKKRTLEEEEEPAP